MQRLSSNLSLLQPQGSHRISAARQEAGKASSWQGKQEEHRRERNVNSNGELCLWSVENMQSSDLPFEAASQRVLFNDVAIPCGPAACPLAIDSFPGSSEGVMGSGRTAGLWISLRN